MIKTPQGELKLSKKERKLVKFLELTADRHARAEIAEKEKQEKRMALGKHLLELESLGLPEEDWLLSESVCDVYSFYLVRAKVYANDDTPEPGPLP